MEQNSVVHCAGTFTQRQDQAQNFKFLFTSALITGPSKIIRLIHTKLVGDGYIELMNSKVRSCVNSELR